MIRRVQMDFNGLGYICNIPYMQYDDLFSGQMATSFDALMISLPLWQCSYTYDIFVFDTT